MIIVSKLENMGLVIIAYQVIFKKAMIINIFL